MDILTHAAIGVIAAGACIETPELALGVLAGSVAPDLDVVSRLFGKKAMLRSHQTVSHSIPVLTVVSFIIMVTPLGLAAAAGFLIGALLHVLMDYTNTLGVTLLWPIDKRRLQIGWLFFIDAWVMGVSLTSATFTIFVFMTGSRPTQDIALIAGVVLAAYWFWKYRLLERAKNLVGDQVISITPSAFLPWHFFLCTRVNDQVSVELLNIYSRSKKSLSSTTILDAEEAALLNPLAEWRLMRSLSPAYHAVSRRPHPTGSIVSCRDLRIRNFKSTYGDLDIHVDSSGNIIKTVFHV